jgi:tRNA(Ile)-lysidine synthase
MGPRITVSGRITGQVRESIRRRHLFPPRSKLVVAVSGGPDSVCLLDLLQGLTAESGVALYVAHLDHQLRGENSRADADYVRRMAERLGLAATIESRDVQAYRALRRISLEEAAREVRYSFLAEVAGSVGAYAAVVGHTLDDNVETILMHLVRGTGTRGLRGLQPVNELRTPVGSLKVIRPLLDVSRSETEAYCRERGLEPRIDQSNRSMFPFRNRVRLELLPVLRRYNPGIGDALTRIGRIASDESDYLDRETSLAWDRVAGKVGDSIVLGRKQLMAVHPALQRQILRRAVAQFVNDLRDIEARHVEKLLGALHAPSGRAFALPGSLTFLVERERYLLGRNTVDLCPFPRLDEEYPLSIPGETLVMGWMVMAAVLPGRQTTAGAPGSEPGATSPEGVQTEAFVSAHGPFVQYVDYDCAGDKLSVRPARPGDRFRPLGLQGSKKVREFMIDAAIPRSWRSRIPVVLNSGGVVWVVGYRIDDRVKVTEATRRTLMLEFRKLA